MSGLTWLPVMATRSGCAILPMPMPSDSETAFTTSWIGSGDQSDRSASRARICASGSRAASLRCLATDASSYAVNGPNHTADFSAISFSVCARSRKAMTSSAGFGPCARS